MLIPATEVEESAGCRETGKDIPLLQSHYLFAFFFLFFGPILTKSLFWQSHSRTISFSIFFVEAISDSITFLKVVFFLEIQLCLTSVSFVSHFCNNFITFVLQEFYQVVISSLRRSSSAAVPFPQL